VYGHVYDVVVDMREGSPTYLKWIGVNLEAFPYDYSDTTTQVYVPPGCAHGFMSRCDNSVVVYMQSGTYDPKAERSVRWDDPTIGVKWPQPVEERNLNAKYIVSQKDQSAEFVNA
jgi:dTDP-4-dehydrorhamnose 3,5-epimerase